MYPQYYPQECDLCLRWVNKLTRHHTRPKKYNKKGERAKTVKLCNDCHKTIHSQFTLKELKDEYDDLGKLYSCPAIKTYLDWIRERPEGSVKHIKMQICKS